VTGVLVVSGAGMQPQACGSQVASGKPIHTSRPAATSRSKRASSVRRLSRPLPYYGAVGRSTTSEPGAARFTRTRTQAPALTSGLASDTATRARRAARFSSCSKAKMPGYLGRNTRGSKLAARSP
jgi:hypothetical protein